MFGIIYLILCILTGMEAVGCLFPRRTAENGNRIWVILPTAFGTGVLMLTWAVYIISWMFSVCAGAEHPLFYGNLLVMTVATLVLAVLFKKKKRIFSRWQRECSPESGFSEKRSFCLQW